MHNLNIVFLRSIYLEMGNPKQIEAYSSGMLLVLKSLLFKKINFIQSQEQNTVDATI